MQKARRSRVYWAFDAYNLIPDTSMVPTRRVVGPMRPPWP